MTGTLGVRVLQAVARVLGFARGNSDGRDGRMGRRNGPTVAAAAWLVLAGSTGLAWAQAPSALPSSIHVALVQATTEVGPSPSLLPPSVQTALKGVTASKPFKSFRLLDQAIVPALGGGGTRLVGPAGAEYVLAVSGGSVSGGAGSELGVAVHMFGTKNGVLEPTAPEVLWGEFTARSGEIVFIWPPVEKTIGGEPLVLLLTPLSNSLAATFLQVPARRAGDVLTGLLSGECGQVVDASWAAGAGQGRATPVAPADWKTSNARLQDGALLFERVRVAPAPAGTPAAKPRAYNIALRDLMAPEFRVSFAPKPDEPFVVFSFMCSTAGCVSVDGAPENVLRIRVCTDKASELMKAVQLVVLQAGRGWQ
jgi:hypothetical protein